MSFVTGPVANVFSHPFATINSQTSETTAISIWLREFMTKHHDMQAFSVELAERKLASTSPGDLIRTLVQDTLVDFEFDDFTSTGVSFLNCILYQGLQRIDWESVGNDFLQQYSPKAGEKAFYTA